MLLFHVATFQTITFEVLNSNEDSAHATRDTFKEQRAIMEAAVSASVDHPNLVRGIT